MAKQDTISAIDVGSAKISCLISKKQTDSSQVNIVGVAHSPSRGIRKGQVVDIEEAVESITTCVEAAERMAGFGVNKAYVSISGDQIESINSSGVVAVNNPGGEITSDDVNRVVEAARAVSLPSSREIIHVLPRHFTVDSQTNIKDPVGMTGVRLETQAHLVTASSTADKNMTKCINELGAEVNQLIFSGLASSCSVLSETEKELGVICLDIGAGVTNVAVFVEGACTHSTVVPLGAKNITNDLAIGLRVSLDSAEKIKQYLSDYKPDGATKKQDEIDLTKLVLPEEIRSVSYKTLTDGIIRPRLSEIFSLVVSSIKNANLSNTTPAGVVICGGGALTVDAVSICKHSMQLPVRIGYPVGLSGLVEEINSPSFATVAGLITFATSLETNSSIGSSNRIGNVFKNVPLRGTADKIVEFVKSFLP